MLLLVHVSLLNFIKSKSRSMKLDLGAFIMTSCKFEYFLTKYVCCTYNFIQSVTKVYLSPYTVYFYQLVVDSRLMSNASRML